jgi:hypothetical protein
MKMILTDGASAPFEEKDVCMMYVNQFPDCFVRINHMWPDEKKGWWKVNFNRLQIPLVMATWILDENQIRGGEFTMNNVPIRLQLMPIPVIAEEPPKEEPPAKPNHLKAVKTGSSKVMSLFGNLNSTPEAS